MPIEPQPCGAGAGDSGPDVEQTLLCDVLPDGSIAGTALAVYEYDETGAPVGAPTFVDPATGLPYVAQGILQPCPGDVGCGAPTQFCFQSTGQVDQPGRMYDTVLNLGQGFAVQALVKDLVETPLNITWQVTDPDGTQFATDLQTALQSQFPGQTVTVTPGAVDPCNGGTAPFAVHIECLRIDQNPPSLLQFKYNAGRDLIINPAFLANPPTNQFAYMKRQDGASPVASVDVQCTNVANRGWENNDKSNAFETWGPPGSGQNLLEGTTPTPRGTVVQEINAYGSGPTPTTGGNAGNPGYGVNPDTIWQTFNVPAPGNFVIKVVVGGRATTENIPIKLSTGDVGDAGIGDVINTSVNAPKVTTEGATPAAPWTTFTQTVPLAAGLYTLAFTGPENQTSTTDDNAFGGLFTDMRVYQDAPNTIQAFTNDDDTCTVPTTETSSVCEYWAPRCAGGEIVGWYNVADGEDLTNAEFWAQVPAPTCCSSSSEGGQSSTGNLVYTYLVCGTLNGEQRTMSRVVVSDQAGGIIADSFIDTDGGPVTPDTWQPGQCATSGPVFAGFVCDSSPFVAATLATCPGTPLAASEPVLTVSTNVAAGPIYEATANDARLNYGEEQDVCSLSLTLTGDTGLTVPEYDVLTNWLQQSDGSVQSLSAASGDSAAAMAAAMGLTPGDLVPPGTTGTIVIGTTTVTLTVDGPGSPRIRPATGAMLGRLPGDGDTQPITFRLDFSPPVRNLNVVYGNTTDDDTGTGRGLTGSQLALATPGTAASGGTVRVKQFRNPNGTSFYENLDGTPHVVTGTIGDCPTITVDSQILCDFGAFIPPTNTFTSTRFRRTFYRDLNGNVIDTVDTDLLTGAPYTPAGANGVGYCGDLDTEVTYFCDLGNLDGPGGTPHVFWRAQQFDVTGSFAGQNAYDLTTNAQYFVTGPVQPWPCSQSTTSEIPESLVLCDITQVPGLDGARSALNLTTLPVGPTAGAFPNGIGYTVDQGTVGGGGTYLITTGTTQTWTFSEPAMLRFGVNNLNIGAECVTLPVGTVVESIHANHTYNALTRVLCNGGAAAQTDESIFTLDAATTLAITSNPGGGGQRGLVRLEAAPTAFTEVRTPFLRTICQTCGEAPVVTDTAMDAVTPYVPAGTVGVCATGSTPETCSNSSTLLVCDTPITGVTTEPATADTNSVPYQTIAGEFPVTGGAAVLWSGGTLNIPADVAAPPDGFTQYTRTAAGLLTAPRPCCDDGTADVTVTMRVVRTGPQPACAAPGSVALRSVSTSYAVQALPLNTPVGTVTDITLSATVPAADLAAGVIAVVTRLETWQTSAACGGVRSGGWTLSQYNATATFDIADCATQFLRTVTVDCTTGTVIATTDTTLDGAPYVPVCEVGQCASSGGQTPATCCDLTDTITLCDDADNTPFLRHLTFDATGAVVSFTDTLYDGTAYTVTGEAVQCAAGCGTASSIGTVCYTPPVAVQTLQDDWTGSTSVVGGGSRVWTNSNFAGQGITVTETVTPDTGAALLGAGVRNTAINPATQHTAIDLGAPRTNVTVRMDFFGSAQGERLRNISPAFGAVSGNGSAVLANTGVDGGPAGDGTIFLNFPGPVQNISWDYAPTGGGLSGQSFISFNTGNASNSAPAAVLRDCETGDTTFVDLATGTVLNPAAISIVDCPGDADTANGLDAEVQILCDANGTRFLRRYVYNSQTGAIASFTDTTLDGSTAFAPVGAVGVCPSTIRDSESFILCSSTPAPGTQFVRTRVYNDLGVVVATVDTTLTGAAFVPGVVSVCATTVTPDTDFLSQVLCDTVGSFLQLQRYNSQTGVLVSTTNLTLTGAAYVPVGAIGACDTCCPVVMGEGCTTVGSLRYTALRLPNGTISLIDSVTGAAVLPANIVACAPANGVLPNVAADHFDAVPGTPWTPAAIPAGRRLVSITYSVITGTATVVDATGGTSIAAIPAGYSATWTAQDDRETLTPPASITSVGGRVIVLMLTAA